MASTNVGTGDVVRAWGRILAGYRPNLSVEITRECPLECPGCYAYGDDHLGGDVTLRGLAAYKGDELVSRFMALVEERRPIHISIVGGEPLVRYRELNEILPKLAELGIHTQLVTSAVRPIPGEWASLRRLQIVVSVDGLAPEHDVRRTPATYERILKHIEGHQITVHCTVTRQQVQREGYLEEFLGYWQANPNTRLIWISLYTPQKGEISAERLTKADRARVIADLRRLRLRFSKLQMVDGMLNVYSEPPASPDDCIFAQTTDCLSSDLDTQIAPCQFGGNPDCSNCGCIASAGLEAIGRHRLRGKVPVGRIFYASLHVGRTVERLRRAAVASGILALWFALMAAPGAQEPRTVWTGAFSNAQAERGAAIYGKECTTCHSDNFQGNIDGGPPLVGKDFEQRWDGLTLLDMVNQVGELMPSDEPATLSRKQWVELFAFLFRANGATMGAADLALDDESLTAVRGTDKPSL